MRTSHIVLVLGALFGYGTLNRAYELAQLPGFANDPGPTLFFMLIGAGIMIGAVVFAHNNKD